jgi:hypothetical protein
MNSTTTRPKSTDRKLRAYAEAANYLVTPGTPGGTDWEVIHLDGHGYTVDPVAGTCECPDHRRRGTACKHIELVKLHVAAEAMIGPEPDEELCLVAEESGDHRAEELRVEAAREAKVLADRALLWD